METGGGAMSQKKKKKKTGSNIVRNKKSTINENDLNVRGKRTNETQWRGSGGMTGVRERKRIKNKMGTIKGRKGQSIPQKKILTRKKSH